MKRMIGLFSGVGGLEMGIHKAFSDAGIALKTVLHCEQDKFAAAILKRHYPDVPVHDDVRTLTDPPPSDVLCMGFPCQDASIANTDGQGVHGERTGLFEEGLRVANASEGCSMILMENVSNIRNQGLEHLCMRFFEEGWNVEWTMISAAACGAPHLRKRGVACATRRVKGWTPSLHAGRNFYRCFDRRPALHGLFVDGKSFMFVEQKATEPLVDQGNPLFPQVFQSQPRPKMHDDLFPTVTRDSTNMRNTKYAQGGQSLTYALQHTWPTLTVKGNYNKVDYDGASGDGLVTAVNRWPTPRTTDASGGPRQLDENGYRISKSSDKKFGANLADKVRVTWPTPRANKVGGDSVERFKRAKAEGKVHTPPLETAVWLAETTNFPTVTKSTAKGVGAIDSKSHQHNLGKRNLHAVIQESVGVTSKLNPEWTERMMGFPVGYTMLEGEPQHEPFMDWGPLRSLNEISDWEKDIPRVITFKLKGRGNRIKAMGNAVVPACAYRFVSMILTGQKLSGAKL